MQIKYRNNGNFEHLYPKTLSGNVEMNSGKTLEEWKGEVDDDLNEIEKDIKDITPSSDLLWEGRNVLDGGKSVKPSKKLNECATGWTLIWTKTGGKQQFQYTNIPKLSLRVGLSSTGNRAVLGSSGGTILTKYFYVENTQIKGHSTNGESGNEDLELIAVSEY